MEYSPLVERIKSEGGDAWNIHTKALEAQQNGQDVIILSVGDPEFNTPDVVTNEAINALKSGETHYTEMRGYDELRDAIAEHYNRTSKVPVTSDEIIIVPGTQNGLYTTAQCILSPGDEVLMLDPSYVTYQATLQATGAKVVKVPTNSDDYFRLDCEALRQAVTTKTKAIFFANPNNPTGRMMDQSEIQAIADLANEHDLWVVSDEVYGYLNFEKPHLNIRDLPGMAERTVVVSSLSKSHAMTGWRSGWVIANRELTEHIERLALNMFYGLPGFIQKAAITAIKHFDEISAQMRAVYQRRCELVIEHLSDCESIKVMKPDAGMFVLLDIRELPVTSDQFIWGLFDNQLVATLDASAFGKAASGFIRLSFAIGEDRLIEACKRIKRYVSELDFSKPLTFKDQLISTTSETIEFKKPEKVIEVVDLHKKFGDNEVLKGVSLTARQGDVISLIGGSGSGKSTLLRCINMLEVPNQGLVYVNGEGIETDIDHKGHPFIRNQKQLLDIRSRLGMVFQNFNLWPHRTVLENLIEAPIHVFGESKAEATDRALALLERVGMAHKKDAYPGFLSGGQQQRVAIARALAVEPKAMLFDEPTSALDPELVGEVLKVIRSLAEEGRTMILVTHEMAFAREVSSHVAFLHQGIIEDEGHPSALFSNPTSERCRQFINAQHNR